MLDEALIQAAYQFGDQARRLESGRTCQEYEWQLAQFIYADAGQPEEVAYRLRLYRLLRPEQYGALVEDHERQIIQAIVAVTDQELGRLSPADRLAFTELRAAWSQPEAHPTREQEETAWRLLHAVGKDVPSDMLTRLVAKLWAALPETVADSLRTVVIGGENGLPGKQVAAVGSETDTLLPVSLFPKADPDAERAELEQVHAALQFMVNAPNGTVLPQAQQELPENLEWRVRALYGRPRPEDTATNALDQQLATLDAELAEARASLTAAQGVVDGAPIPPFTMDAFRPGDEVLNLEAERRSLNAQIQDLNAQRAQAAGAHSDARGLPGLVQRLDYRIAYLEARHLEVELALATLQHQPEPVLDALQEARNVQRLRVEYVTVVNQLRRL